MRNRHQIVAKKRKKIHAQRQHSVFAQLFLHSKSATWANTKVWSLGLTVVLKVDKVEGILDGQEERP